MRTILLVEDDAHAIALMEAILEPQVDWRLIVATTGEEAFEMAAREHPEVVLLEVALPGMTGIEICRHLKSDPITSNAQVLFLTGTSQRSIEAEARAAGADDYLVKPFGNARLVETIKLRLATN